MLRSFISCDGAALEHRRHPDVLQRRQRAEQVVALEDEADVLAELDRPAFVDRGELPVQDIEGALLHPPQGTDQCQQRRLARARRPGHDHDLAPADLQRVVEEHLGPDIPLPVPVADPLGAGSRSPWPWGGPRRSSRAWTRGPGRGRPAGWVGALRSCVCGPRGVPPPAQGCGRIYPERADRGERIAESESNHLRLCTPEFLGIPGSRSRIPQRKSCAGSAEASLRAARQPEATHITTVSPRMPAASSRRKSIGRPVAPWMTVNRPRLTTSPAR